MLTLSQATSDSRIFLKILLIIVGGLLSIILIFRIIFALKEIISPTPPTPPTVSFEKIPQIEFPSSATEKKLSFKIDTLSGQLPNFSDRAYVNKMEGYLRNVLEVDDANNRVSSVGFPILGNKLSDTIYRWSDTTSIQRQITMDVVTKDFVLSSIFINDPVSLSQTTLINTDQAKQTASGFMSNMNEVPADLDDSKTSTTLYAVDNQALIPATSLSKAQIIGVYFFQENQHDLPIMYPRAETSTMNFLIGSGEKNAQVVAANFSHQSVSQTSGTYPIKTAQEAFDELKKGKGYISTYYLGENISIKNVFLAYFIGEEKQPYLMPIVVFQGDNGFYAYVSAVKDEWIKN